MGIGFGVDTAPALVCGYVVATLFAMISVTPQGVGVVEAAVVVAFTSFGESAAAGTAIGLVYRGIVFWMPFIIGAVLINTTKAFKGDVKKAAYDQDMGAVAGTAATAARLEEEARADAVRFRRAAALRSRMANAHAAHGGEAGVGEGPSGAGPSGVGAAASGAAKTVPFAEGAGRSGAAQTVPFAESAESAPAADTVPFAEGAGSERASVTVPLDAPRPASADGMSHLRAADLAVNLPEVSPSVTSGDLPGEGPGSPTYTETDKQ